MGWVFMVALLGCACLAESTPITALSFSPDGHYLVSTGDRCLSVRSPRDASVRRRVACDLMMIRSLAFSPNGRLLAVGGGEPGVQGEVRLLTWPEGKMVNRLTNHTDLVTQVAFDATGNSLGVASVDRTADVWSCDEHGTTARSSMLVGHAGPVLSIGFSSSGQSVVTVSADRSVKVWSRDGGRLQRSLSQHTEAVHALAFRPAAGANEHVPSLCATAGDDHTVRIWQPDIGRMIRIVRQHEGPVFALAWARDGSTLFSAGREGIIRAIDGDSDTLQAQWKAHQDWVYILAVSPDGATLASGDWSGEVRVHSLRSHMRGK